MVGEGLEIELVILLCLAIRTVAVVWLSVLASGVVFRADDDADRPAPAKGRRKKKQKKSC